MSHNLPAHLGNRLHRLEGKALKDWWSFFYRRGPDKGHVVFLVFVPLAAFLIWKAALPFNQRTLSALVQIGLLGWVASLLLWLDVIRHYLRHVLEVISSEDGLILRSLAFHKRIRWLEIVDCFSIQDGEYLLLTKDDEFFLSGNLSNSAELFQKINSKLTSKSGAYDWSYRVPQPMFDMANSSGAFLIFGPLLLIYSAFLGLPLKDVVAFALSIVWMTPICFVIWMQHFKTPVLIRAGKTGLFIRLRSTDQTIAWEQITDIKSWAISKGVIVIIQSRLGWFAFITELIPQKGNLNNLLLECKEKFLLAKPTGSIARKP